MEAVRQTSPSATFSGWFDAETLESSRPNKGAITLESDQLILEADSATTTVPLSTVRDIRLDNVHYEHGPFPPGRPPVTIVYEEGGDTVAATIAAKGAVIRPLTVELLEAILTGSPVRVRHPTKLGHRTTPKSFERGTLTPSDGTLYFDTGQDELLQISDAVSFERTEGDGTSRYSLRITALRGGTQYQTDIRLPNERTTALLGQYLTIQTKLDISSH